MMDRKTALIKLAAHPMIGKIYNKLSEEELSLVTNFVHKHHELSIADFEYKANRWFLDDPNKPKRLSDMWAILVEINTFYKLNGGK